MTMSTFPLPHPAAVDWRDAELKSRVRRMLDALLAAREADARRQVRYHLATLSDARLLSLGFSAAEIHGLRTAADTDRLLVRRALV
jgi:hypothetical protein